MINFISRPVLYTLYRGNEKKTRRNQIKGGDFMRATKKNIKLLNEYIHDIGRATMFIYSRHLLTPDEFIRMPLATQKLIYEGHLVIFTWIRHDLDILYSIVNDKEYKPFNGEKHYQRWLKSKEKQPKKKYRLTNDLKD